MTAVCPTSVRLVSAIFGVVGLDGRPWTGVDLEAVAQAVAPLGPDGGGTWAGTAGRCGVAVGAALRISTREDEADRQPSRGRDGSLVVAADIRSGSGAASLPL